MQRKLCPRFATAVLAWIAVLVITPALTLAAAAQGGNQPGNQSSQSGNSSSNQSSQPGNQPPSPSGNQPGGVGPVPDKIPPPGNRQQTIAEKIAASKTKMDINTATAAQLKTLPGVGENYAARIIAGRPYTAKNQLVQRGVLPQNVYAGISELIIAHRPKS